MQFLKQGKCSRFFLHHSVLIQTIFHHLTLIQWFWSNRVMMELGKPSFETYFDVNLVSFHQSEAIPMSFTHFGVIPSFRGHFNLVKSFCCHSIIQDSCPCYPIILISFQSFYSHSSHYTVILSFPHHLPSFKRYSVSPPCPCPKVQTFFLQPAVRLG